MVVWKGLAYVVVELEVVWMVDELLVVEAFDEVISVVVLFATLVDSEAEEETEIEEELDDVNVGAEVEDEAFVVVVQAIGPWLELAVRAEEGIPLRLDNVDQLLELEIEEEAPPAVLAEEDMLLTLLEDLAVAVAALVVLANVVAALVEVALLEELFTTVVLDTLGLALELVLATFAVLLLAPNVFTTCAPQTPEFC